MDHNAPKIKLHFLLVFLVLILPSTLLSEQKPNFLVIITDDQNDNTVTAKWMPYTRAEIFDRGIDFKQAYITNPQCCPSRASIFTGLYSRNHGQLSNAVKYDLKEVDTCAYYLRQLGYTTGIVGKYLNSHKEGYLEYQQRQFDFWRVSRKTNQFTANNNNYERFREHSSTWIADNTIEFLKGVGNKPFLMYVGFHEPHGLSRLDNNYKKIFNRVSQNELQSELPNFHKLTGIKPKWLQKGGFLKRDRKELRREKDSFHKLQVVDLHIKSIIEALKANNQYDNTYIFFISDNGVLYGQHGLYGKSLPYETAIKVPFALRGPKIKPTQSSALVSNIDIAPTIYKLAGLEQHTDGIDLLSQSRDHLFIEGAYGRVRAHQTPFIGMLYQNWRLFVTATDLNELYNIESDPHQMRNLFYVKTTELQEVREFLLSKLSEF